jgi:hypothetical protein
MSIITKLNNASNKFFTDWRILDQSSVGLEFDKRYCYYVHARAWALKGYLGGMHSWFVFWSMELNDWLVVELNDRETLEIQNANILYIWKNVGYQEYSPTISKRVIDGKWFDASPIIAGKSLLNFDYSDIVKLCDDYPYKEFSLTSQNCVTFTSYLIYKLNLKISRPFRSIGFKNRKFWNRLYNAK